MIPLAITLAIILGTANIIAAIVWPNPKLDWINYMATGMAISAVIYMVMR